MFTSVSPVATVCVSANIDLQKNTQKLLHWSSATKKQVAQLSQRDRAVGSVSFWQKWKTIFCRQYKSIFSHCGVIGLQFSYQIQ